MSRDAMKLPMMNFDNKRVSEIQLFCPDRYLDDLGRESSLLPREKIDQPF